MGWKNVMGALKSLAKQNKATSAKVVSKASLEDGIKDPMQVHPNAKKRIQDASYKKMNGQPFKDEQEMKSEFQKRQKSVSGTDPDYPNEQEDDSEQAQLKDLLDRLSGDENRASEWVETKFSGDTKNDNPNAATKKMSEDKKQGLKRLIKKYKKPTN